jgi:hypothetical protein
MIFWLNVFDVLPRNFETVKLQYRHFDLNCVSDDPQRVPFIKVNLTDRKGWQNKMSSSHSGPIQGESQMQYFRIFFAFWLILIVPFSLGNVYHIYPQPDLPHVDASVHLKAWLDFLEKYVLVRDLKPDDYIFGPPQPNGTMNAAKPVSHDVVQSWITNFAKAAGINLHYGSFTTHCFRRGGAQYRFMYAPTGRRWSLAVVRWWGGWSEGEHVRFLFHFFRFQGDLSSNSASERLHDSVSPGRGLFS